MELAINPLSDALGAEITGINLNDPEEGIIDAIKDAVHEHLVVVIRNQSMTPAQYASAASRFGTMAEQHMSDLMMKDQPRICRLDSSIVPLDENGKPKLIGSGNWHTDHTNFKRPPKYTILYAEKLPRKGGDTGFANMQKAFESLSENEQAKLLQLKTANALVGKPAHTTDEDMDKYGTPKIHPFIRTHPATGKKAIYCHPQKVAYIEGMDRETSLDLIADLQARTINSSTMYRHKWQPGDMLICDNRGAMHRAFHDYDHTEGRIMHRILIEGEVPV